MKLSKYIDHTLLKADSVEMQFAKLCQEAKDYDFKTVCVNPSWIKYCKEALKGSDVEVCTVIGFPLGQMTTAAKAFEAQDAIANGANEVDMVINISALKDKKIDYVINDIKEVKKACGDHVLKVIIEICLLTDEEIVEACKAVVAANADFVKTSTGFSTHGATVEAVKLMKDTVKDQALVKAAGGVRSYEGLLEMIEAGADRIGTSSGCALLDGQHSKAEY